MVGRARQRREEGILACALTQQHDDQQLYWPSVQATQLHSQQTLRLCTGKQYSKCLRGHNAILATHPCHHMFWFVLQWLCFDACPVTACLPYTARRMAANTPNAKLIFMVSHVTTPAAEPGCTALTLACAWQPVNMCMCLCDNRVCFEMSV